MKKIGMIITANSLLEILNDEYKKVLMIDDEYIIVINSQFLEYPIQRINIDDGGDVQTFLKREDNIKIDINDNYNFKIRNNYKNSKARVTYVRMMNKWIFKKIYN